MVLTCACGKCDTSEVESKGELLELCLKTSHDEAVKSTNALWRSRIQKRIDELKESIEGFRIDISNGVERDVELFNQLKVVKHELEGLLK